MKSARERAEAAYHEAADAFDREDAIVAIERLFKEHAREALYAAGNRLMAEVRGRAPSPGEQR